VSILFGQAVRGMTAGGRVFEVRVLHTHVLICFYVYVYSALIFLIYRASAAHTASVPLTS